MRSGELGREQKFSHGGEADGEKKGSETCVRKRDASEGPIADRGVHSHRGFAELIGY